MGEIVKQDKLFNKEKIKDWSAKKQINYYQGYVKESVQQANFRKGIKTGDLDRNRKNMVKNMTTIMKKEGILKSVPSFMKDVFKIGK